GHLGLGERGVHRQLVAAAGLAAVLAGGGAVSAAAAAAAGQQGQGHGQCEEQRKDPFRFLHHSIFLSVLSTLRCHMIPMVPWVGTRSPSARWRKSADRGGTSGPVSANRQLYESPLSFLPRLSPQFL